MSRLRRLAVMGRAGGGGDYAARVLGLHPYAYWPLDDAAGSTAARELVNGWTSGGIAGVTFGVTGIGDGNTAVAINGESASGIALPSASMAATFPKDEGSYAIWLKLATAEWEDGASRNFMHLHGGSDNYIGGGKIATNNTINGYRRALGTTKAVSTTETRTDWLSVALTWSVAGNALKYYVNGLQQGTTQTTIQSWGAVTIASGYIGRNVATGAAWKGQLAHVALFSRPLTPTELLALATI